MIDLGLESGLEAWGLDAYEPVQVLFWAGLALGAAFGVLAQISRFCLRRAIVEQGAERRRAGGVWIGALGAATLATALLVQGGALDLSGHRYLSADLPLGGLLAGGLMFGIGMVLTRGCISRLTVLAASGNLRAATVLLVFAVTAYATLRGVLAPFATDFASATTVDGAGGALLGGLGVSGGVVALVIGGVALSLAFLSGARPAMVALGLGIGGLVALGWFATGILAFDEFDPQPAESLAFTSSTAGALFYAMAATALEPNFGLGLVIGALAGAHLSARIRGELALASFESPAQTLRYLLGAVLMGVGGVLAGGCTVGNGLSGVSSLGVGPMIGLAAIVLGGFAAQAVLARREAGERHAAIGVPAE